MNIKLENQVNIEDIKEILQHTVDGLKLYGKKSPWISNMLIGIMTIMVVTVCVFPFLQDSVFLKICLLETLILIGILAGYVYNLYKIDRKNHELLSKQIAEIKSVKDIPPLINDIRNKFSKVVKENQLLPYYALETKWTHIWEFERLSEEKILEINVSPHSTNITLEGYKGDVSELKINAEVIKNTKVNDITIILTGLLSIKVLVPYGDKSAKTDNK